MSAKPRAGSGNDISHELILAVDEARLLDRHVHYLLIRVDKFVAHFGHGAERQSRLLNLEHHLGEVDALIAGLVGVRERR